MPVSGWSRHWRTCGSCPVPFDIIARIFYPAPTASPSPTVPPPITIFDPPLSAERPPSDAATKQVCGSSSVQIIIRVDHHPCGSSSEFGSFLGSFRRRTLLTSECSECLGDEVRVTLNQLSPASCLHHVRRMTANTAEASHSQDQ